jgi:hypothetical protein
MSPQLKTLLASLAHAARQGKPAYIGSGIYSPVELRAAVKEVESMAAAQAQPKPKPVPWTLDQWHKDRPNEWLIMAGDHIVTSSFIIESYSRERLVRALDWLNEQED